MSDTMCRSGDSHYAGCACHESAWAAKLAAAHGHADSLRRGAISWRERAWKAEAETKEDLAERLAAAEARAEKAISDTVQEFGLRRAAEARVRALEGALTTINLMCADGYYGPYAFTYAMEAKRIASEALAPPPEAEKPEVPK